MVLFIGIAQTHGLPTASGAVILTGLFYFVALPLFTRLLKFFPPIVIGTMIVIVGVKLVKVGAQLIFGRPDQPGFGNLPDIALGLGTIGITVLVFLFSTGMLRRVAVMLGLVGGTVLGLGTGSRTSPRSPRRACSAARACCRSAARCSTWPPPSRCSSSAPAPRWPRRPARR